MKRLFIFLLAFTLIGVLGLGKAYAAGTPVTPSTNDINKTNGWAHVNQISSGIGTTKLQFVSTRGFNSCFEYRTDGDTTEKINATNYNTLVTDGLYPYYCQSNNSRTVSISANEYVEIRMVFGAESDERFDWTRFDVETLTEYKGEDECTPGKIPTQLGNLTTTINSQSATPTTISLPSIGEYLFKVEGTYGYGGGPVDNINNRADAGYATTTASWTSLSSILGITPGTTYRGVTSLLSDMGTGEMGIVDWGSYNTDHKYEFNYTPSSVDVQFVISDWWDSWYAGGVNNNQGGVWDNEGTLDIKVFQCLPDTDGDTIPDSKDFCANTAMTTEFGTFIKPVGVNRWYFDGVNWKQQLNKNGNGGRKTPFTIEDTYGCSCHEILDLLKDAGLGEFGGHYKFGCSTSILEDFNMYVEDGTINGKYYIETVTVPANKATNTLSSSLVSGIEYLLVAKGSWINSQNVADAEYISKDGWVTRLDGYDIDPYFLGEGAFDLQINDTFVNWGIYNTSHTYEINYLGSDSPLRFRIFDGDSSPLLQEVGWYGDNSGTLTVDIYGVL